MQVSIQMAIIISPVKLTKRKSDTNYLKTNGISISLGKQLKWPDDYFQPDVCIIKLYRI
jgi:hypothetical protein